MKEDVHWNHQDGYLPILDTKMAFIDGRIVFEHYTKPMASKETVLARSAMSMGNKINIIVAEGSRILRNCSLDLPWNVRTKHLDNLMISMKWGGYPYSVRSTVV